MKSASKDWFRKNRSKYKSNLLKPGHCLGDPFCCACARSNDFFFWCDVPPLMDLLGFFMNQSLAFVVESKRYLSWAYLRSIIIVECHGIQFELMGIAQCKWRRQIRLPFSDQLSVCYLMFSVTISRSRVKLEMLKLVIFGIVSLLARQVPME